jgi:tetratricopeptide (TPR) repeat protein
VDWFWEFPGLTAPALALLGAATAVGRPAEAPRGDAVTRGRLATAGALGLAMIALAAALIPPWLAERDIARASDRWAASPDAAFDRLDRAEGLNPLSPKAYLVAGTIALRLGRTGKAEEEFRQALRRDPDNGYALLELGLIAAQRGQRGRAVRLLERRVRLTPRDDVVREALAAVRRGVRIDAARVNRALQRRAQLRVGRPR